MVKASTKKSRGIGAVGIATIAIALITDAWFSPPLPRIATPLLSFVTVGLMQWAAQERDNNGIEIPPTVGKAVSGLANIEAAIALAIGLSIGAVLLADFLGASRLFRQIETVVTLALYVAIFIVDRLVVRPRFARLMKAAGADLGAS
jgi:hypothetical protein